MGANVADFTVVEDKFITVDNENGPDTATRPLKFRGGLLRDLDGIFSFVIVRSNNLRLRVEINNNLPPIYDDNFANTNGEKVMHEVFSMRNLNLDSSGTETVRFTAVRGSGTFSDVIVWYRRDSE